MYGILIHFIDELWNAYCSYANEHFSILITILTSLLTGGFLMIFIENNHMGDNVVDRYHFIMQPFMHRLSNYFKFISSAKTFYIINREDKEENVKTFKSLLDNIGKLAHPCIMSGQDYPSSKFTAKQLDKLCDDINNIWYYWDRYHNYMKGHYIYETDNAEHYATYGHDFLKEVFPTEFSNRKFSMDLISDVSGKFYTNIWQPIQDVPILYEYWQKQEYDFKNISMLTIVTSLITIALILLFRFLIPMWIPTTLTLLCMGCLGYSIWKMVKLDQLSRKIFR